MKIIPFTILYPLQITPPTPAPRCAQKEIKMLSFSLCDIFFAKQDKLTSLAIYLKDITRISLALVCKTFKSEVYIRRTNVVSL